MAAWSVERFFNDCLKRTPVIGTLRLGGMHWIRRLFRDRQRDKAMTWARGHYEEPLQVTAGEVGYWIHVLLDYPYSTFVPTSRLREDLALEPAELLQVSLALGEKWSVFLTPEQTAKCETIDDLVRLVKDQMVNARIVGAFR